MTFVTTVLDGKSGEGTTILTFEVNSISLESSRGSHLIVRGYEGV